MHANWLWWMGICASLILTGSHAAAADPAGQVVELWPGKVPDDIANMGAEKVVMSPALDRKQVEITESTRMLTNVSRPTLTICRPAKDADTGTAMLICPGGGYWNRKVKDKDELAPWLSIPAGTPPIFLGHGGDDIISDAAHSVVAYLTLKRAGVPAELHVYATSTHDFGVRANDRTCGTWTQSCAAWLRQQGLLKPS